MTGSGVNIERTGAKIQRTAVHEDAGGGRERGGERRGNGTIGIAGRTAWVGGLPWGIGAGWRRGKYRVERVEKHKQAYPDGGDG